MAAVHQGSSGHGVVGFALTTHEDPGTLLDAAEAAAFAAATVRAIGTPAKLGEPVGALMLGGRYQCF